ncbi:MAG: M48 family metallopeptidase [bacterium]|nr:M48 family metallopeptidase [bacterium]
MATVYTHIRSNKFKSIVMVVLTMIFALGVGAIFAYAADYGPIAIVLAAVIGVPMTLTGYFAGDKIALAVNGAKQVQRETNRDLYNVVENIAITAGLPTPKIYIIPDEAPNAFATGRDPRRASIALTAGLLRSLDQQELEGVVAHELAHIGDYDTRYMTIVAVMTGLIVLMSEYFLRFSWITGGGRRRSSNDSGNAQGIIFLIGIAIAILAPIVATLTRLAISRRREALADAKGAEITRQPERLADALLKISRYDRPARFANAATSPLYFADVSKLKGSSFLSRILADHPPVEERVNNLYRMAGLKSPLES